jgi:O-antigen ligase
MVIDKEKKETYLIVLLNIFLISIAISSPWLNNTISNHDFVKSYFAFFGLALIMIFSIYMNLKNEEIILKINPIKISLLILFLAGLFSLFWSVNTDLTINKILLWTIGLFSFVIAKNLNNSSENLLSLTWGLVLMAGAIAFVGILQYLLDPFTLTQAASPSSTFGNKNIASQPLVLIFPLSLILIVSNKSHGIKAWIITISIALILSYIFYTKTRAVWIALFFEIILIVSFFINYWFKSNKWIDWNKNKTYASIFGILLLFVLINLNAKGYINFLSVSLESVNSISNSVSNSSSPRYQIWKTTLDIFNDSPFIGSGLGTYSQNIATEGFATWNINNTFRAHNDILELATELGILGITIFIILIVSVVICVFKILKETRGHINFFYFLIFTAFSGSFINLQFSFPYQMTVPIVLFGLYCGLISGKIDHEFFSIDFLKININLITKKILTIILTCFFILVFSISYLQWIKAYNQLEKINTSNSFGQISLIETPIYHKDMQFMLYSLGGNYFNKGKFKQSSVIDWQFLKIWPNHLDVLFRYSYALHSLNQNNRALELAEKLKKIEPPGIYNSYILKLFIFSSLKKKNKFEKIFLELQSQPEKFLKLSKDTYRYLIFFTLNSANLFKYTPDLYQKYHKYHGYSCEVNNNMAIYYFNLEKYEKSSKFVNNAFENDSSCLNPKLVEILVEKELISPDTLK